MTAISSLVLTLALGSGQDTVLLDFYGDTCPPCRQMAPVVEQLAARGVPVRKVNVQREPALAAQFGVRAIPCFVMVVGGREVDRVVGATSLDRLEQMASLGRPAKSANPVPIRLASNDSPSRGTVAIPAVQTRDPFTTLAGSNSLDRVAASGVSQPSQGPGWQSTPPASSPTEKNPVSAETLLACSARLRIQDASGSSVGSGTIIDARSGWALILTCGHLFREYQPGSSASRIEVDLFGPEPAERLPGELVHFDLTRDLGLIKIRMPGRVMVAPVAPANFSLAKGARVTSVGCNNGDNPTAVSSQITFLNRYEGPPNIRATGLPVQGRSGGGLFSSEGYVIGVCNAAISPENEGLYSALGAIHDELREVGLGFVCGDSKPAEAKAAPANRVAQDETPSMPRQMPPPGDVVRLTQATDPAAPRGNAASQLSGEERATLEEIERRRGDGAEVICIIRPRNDPAAPSEVIVLEKASPEFLRGLTSPATAPQREAEPVREPRASQRLETSQTSDRLVPVQRASASAGTTTGELEWEPRWLRPGYQGS